ncbi:hypothetical protein D1872_260730 [compost metagenome]
MRVNVRVLRVSSFFSHPHSKLRVCSVCAMHHYPPVSALNRTAHEAPDEVFLQQEKDRQRHQHRNKRRGGQQVPVVAPGTDQVGNLHRHDLYARLVADKDEGYQVIVPYPEELEDPDLSERGHRQRQNQPGENRKVAGSVNERRLEQIPRQLADEVVHKVSHQRQTERRVRQPDT